MKNKFPGYFVLSDDSKSHLWKTATIVPDANVLLHFFRQDKETVSRLFGVFGSIKDRLWVPYQAAEEFHRNRIGVIFDRRNAYSGISKYFSDLITSRLPSELGRYKPHPVLDIDEIIKLFSNDIDKTLQRIKEKLEMHPGDSEFNKTLLGVGDIFEGKVGAPLSNEEIENICSEGEQRYRNQIPPGYKDAKEKEGRDKYGDLIIWKEIIKKSNSDSSDIILVTDDKKQDWWLDHHGETISPRPELIKEFQDQTSQKIIIYRFRGFLEDARKYINGELPSIEIADTESIVKTSSTNIENEKEKIALIRKLRRHMHEVNILEDNFQESLSQIKSISDSIGQRQTTKDEETILTYHRIYAEDLRKKIASRIKRIEEIEAILSTLESEGNGRLA